MADELTNVQTEPSFVSPDTDDLDAFNDLLQGRAKVAEPKEEGNAQEKDDNQKVDETDSSDDNTDKQTDSNSEDGPDEEDSPDGDEDKPDDADDKPVKKTNRYQERINELTAKAREAERREKEVLRRLDELAAKQDSATDNKPSAAPVAKENTGPSPDDTNDDGSEKYPLGEFDPDYIRDLTRHTIQSEQAQANERQAKEQAEREATQAREQLQEQWVEKLTNVTATHEDFMEKTIELEDTFDGLDPQYSDYLVQTIKSLDHGPEVLYHFANNLDEAQKFVKMGPLAATLALGEMNARFKKQEEKPKPQPKLTAAPPPPQVANKGNKSRTTVAADTDDLDAFSQVFFKPRGTR